MSGLEDIARLIDRYKVLVDKVSLQSTDTESKKEFVKAVIRLYTKILEYQIHAVCYFGRNTFIRILGNIPKIDDWAKRLQAVKEEDVACQKHMNILVWEDQHAGMITLKQIMEQQNQRLHEECAKRNSIPEQAETDNILSWISPIPVGDDHETVRANLGSRYNASGRWLLTCTEYSTGRAALLGCSGFGVLWIWANFASFSRNSTVLTRSY